MDRALTNGEIAGCGVSVSLWQREGGGSETLTCDVAVIGAGITGLSAAIELERRGLSVVVLEARGVGLGASGRNAGYLMRGAADNYAAACRDWGRDRARALWTFTEENLRLLRQDGVAELPSFAERPSCLAAVSAEEEAELRESAALLREDGFAVELLEREQGPAGDVLWDRAGVRVGLVNPADATVSPYALVGWLRSRLVASRVLAGFEVDRIEAKSDGIDLRGRSNSPELPAAVRAGRVLGATNAWGSVLWPGVGVEPNRGQMLAARPSDPADAGLAFAYYLNHGSEYVRRGPNGLVIVGGARKHDEEGERGHGQEVTASVQRQLEAHLQGWVTADYVVEARWAGTMGFGPRGLPVVQRVAGEGAHAVWFCGGFTGHGMSMAYAAAREAVGVMLEETGSIFLR